MLLAAAYTSLHWPAGKDSKDRANTPLQNSIASEYILWGWVDMAARKGKMVLGQWLTTRPFRASLEIGK